MENTADFYWEDGFMVFKEAYHLKRGYCCKNGCRHCPYGFKKNKMKQKVTVSWSGGKDSVFALYKVMMADQFEIVSLHTVIDEKTRRVGLHGVPEALIQKQAQAIGFPLTKIYLPASKSDKAYKLCMANFYAQCVNEGIDGVVFGDIFLEDLRDFRKNLLKPHGLFGSFPLWGSDSITLLKDFMHAGFKTTICSANADLFSEHELGKILDHQFLDSLSPTIDACGENGEYHTFVCDGPLFKRPIPVTKGKVVRKTYSYGKKNADGKTEMRQSTFWFQELIS
jgi:uncharacterized protein (TIGR00290 family)